MDYSRFDTRVEPANTPRATITLTDAGRDAINRSSDEGRKLINALSEHFSAPVTIDYDPALRLLLIETGDIPVWRIDYDTLFHPGFRAHLLAQELLRLHIARSS